MGAGYPYGPQYGAGYDPGHGFHEDDWLLDGDRRGPARVRPSDSREYHGREYQQRSPQHRWALYPRRIDVTAASDAANEPAWQSYAWREPEWDQDEWRGARGAPTSESWGEPWQEPTHVYPAWWDGQWDEREVDHVWRKQPQKLNAYYAQPGVTAASYDVPRETAYAAGAIGASATPASVRIAIDPNGGRRHARSRRRRLWPIWLLINVIIVAAAGVLVAPHVLATQQTVCMWYTVSSGDSVTSLAQRYHTDAATLASVNQLANPGQLYAGQQVCIPIATSADVVVVPAQPPTSKPAPTQAPKPAPKNPGVISGRTAFIAFALPYARRAHAATGWPVSVILAQWGLEHGWKLPGFTGYNFGNVGAEPGEPTIPGTQAWGSPSRFSYARTPEDGLRQYVKCAHLHYYTAIAPAAKISANAAAVALGASPWDAGHYGGAAHPGSSLLALMREYNLYQYDR